MQGLLLGFVLLLVSCSALGQARKGEDLIIIETRTLSPQEVEELVRKGGFKTQSYSLEMSSVQRQEENPFGRTASFPVFWGGDRAWDPVFQSSDVRAAQKKAYLAYIESEVHAMKHRMSVYDAQVGQTRVISFVVILLVIAGVGLSIWQFAHKIPKDATSLEVSSTGVKITSQLVGLAMLVVSLGFFYLYLVHVYKIEEVGGTREAVEAPKADAAKAKK